MKEMRFCKLSRKVEDLLTLSLTHSLKLEFVFGNMCSETRNQIKHYLCVPGIFRDLSTQEDLFLPSKPLGSRYTLHLDFATGWTVKKR